MTNLEQAIFHKAMAEHHAKKAEIFTYLHLKDSVTSSAKDKAISLGEYLIRITRVKVWNQFRIYLG